MNGVVAGDGWIWRGGVGFAVPAAIVAALALAALLAGRPQPAHHVASLPLVGRLAVSRALARDDRAYWVRRARGALVAASRGQRLSERFARGGVVVSAGAGSIGLATRAVGRGSRLAPLTPAAPRADRDRVSFAHRGLLEWYANGPLGLEQGFTLDAPPRGRGALSLRVAVSGSLRPLAAERRTAVAMVDRSGATAMTYRGLSATDARGHVLHAWLGLRGRAITLSVDDRGASYPLRIDPVVQRGKVTASDGGSSDNLGFSVAVDGTTAVAGAYQATVNGNFAQGAAYVFVEPPTGWTDATETAKLTASDGADSSDFGFSVGISGDTIAVGASAADSAKGALYVFAKPSGGWISGTETAKLTASDGAGTDTLGKSVAISGDTIVGGAPGAGSAKGAAYVFVKPPAGWVTGMESAKLTASGGAAGDELGTSVGVSGDTAIVGAPFAAIGVNHNQGAAYVFAKPPGGWTSGTETAKLTAPDGSSNDELATAVGMSGETAVAGAPGANGSQGAAYVFVKPVAGWASATQTAKLTASDGAAGDKLGSSVAAAGETIVAGAPGVDSFRGAVYAYAQPSSGWTTGTETAKLVASDSSQQDLGHAVAVSGSTVVAGAPQATLNNHSSQGAAYVFAFGAPPPPARTVTVALAGSGSGSVSGDQSPAISCPGACSQQYADGTAVTLTEHPAAGSTFSGWSGGGCGAATTCELTVHADTSVTAAFAASSGGGGGGGGSGGGGAGTPTASLVSQTPSPQGVTLSAAGTTVPPGQRVTSYTFRLGTDGVAQETCPGNQPRLNAFVTRAGNTSATVSVTTDAGTTASATAPVSVGATGSLPRVRVGPKAFLPATGSQHPSTALGQLGVVALQCQREGGTPSQGRSRPASQVQAAEEAPTTANAQVDVCGTPLKIGIVEGVGCFQQVDATHRLPNAEAKLLCAHERVCIGSGGVPPAAFIPIASGSASRARAAQSCNFGDVGFDAVYYSMQPVAIDGLEIDPVNGGAVVVARAGLECTGFATRDSAYLLSSDAIVKVGGLPITLKVPDYGKAYSQAKGAATCAQNAAGGLSNGDLSSANCLGSLSVPSVPDVQHLLPQTHGPIDLSVSPKSLGIELGEFEVPDNVLPLPVLPSLPLSGSLKVNLTGIGSATVAIHVELPGVLSDSSGHGLTGNTTLAIDNANGLQLNDLDISVPSFAQLGLARLENVEFHYKRPSFFHAMGTIDLSDVINGLVAIEVTIDKGRFQSGQVKYFSQSGGGFPLFGPLYLTQLTAGLNLDPVHLHGDTQISVGPSVTNNGCGSLGIHGTADLVFGNPWTLDATGQASVLCADLGPSKVFHADSNGHVSYGETFDYSVPGIGSVVGDEFGQAYAAIHDPLHGLNPGDELDIQLDGKLAGDFHVHECVDLVFGKQLCTGDVHFSPSVDGTLALGYRGGRLVGGAGICASLGVTIAGRHFGFDVGAGIDDLPQAILALGTDNFPALASQFKILLDNCNVSKWQLLPPPVGFAGAHAAQAQPYKFQMPAGQKVAVVGIAGDGGAPQVVLSGPGGKRIQALSDGINVDGGALFVRQPSSGQTLIEIPDAARGAWTIQPIPGSARMKTVELARELPQPVIHTDVSGRGAHRVLHYRIKPQPGLSVRFLEGVDGGAHAIGVAHGARGKIRFTPAVGSAKPRTIIARIERNGEFAPSQVVGRFSPGKLVPGRARRIRVSHGRRGWQLSWRPGRYATSQLLTIRFVDGAQVLLSATGGQRALTLSPSLDGGAQPTAVAIVALRGQTRGRAVTIVARRVRRR